MARVVLLFVILVQAAFATAEEFRIGVSLPLTGDLAEYGAAVRNGLTLSVQEKPESTLRFVFEDNQYDAATAVTAYRRLTDEAQVKLIFSWGEAPLHATAGLAEREAFPLLAMSVDAQPARGKQFVMLAVNHPREYVQKILGTLRAKGIKRFAFIATQDPFLEALLTEVRSLLTAQENFELIEAVLPEERDFRAAVTRLQRKQFDALGVYLLPGQVQAFYRQLSQNKIQVTTFGTDTFESRAEVAGAGGAMEGALYPNIAVPTDFAARYRSTFNSDAQISYAYNAYIIGLLCERLFGSGKIDGAAAIMQALKNASDPAGRFSRAATDDGIQYLKFPLTIREIRNGGFVDYR